MRCAIFSSLDFTSRAQARYKSTCACMASTNPGPSAASGSMPGGISTGVLSESLRVLGISFALSATTLCAGTTGTCAACPLAPCFVLLLPALFFPPDGATSAHPSRSIPAGAVAPAAVGKSRRSTDAAPPGSRRAPRTSREDSGRVSLPSAEALRSWPFGLVIAGSFAVSLTALKAHVAAVAAVFRPRGVSHELARMRAQV